jgi:hypothetical protein
MEHPGGPKSEFARYAFGYSDRKPGATYWLIVGGMTAFVIYQFSTLAG